MAKGALCPPHDHGLKGSYWQRAPKIVGVAWGGLFVKTSKRHCDQRVVWAGLERPAFSASGASRFTRRLRLRPVWAGSTCHKLGQDPPRKVLVLFRLIQHIAVCVFIVPLPRICDRVPRRVVAGEKSHARREQHQDAIKAYREKKKSAPSKARIRETTLPASTQWPHAGQSSPRPWQGGDSVSSHPKGPSFQPRCFLLREKLALGCRQLKPAQSSVVQPN